MLAHFWRGYVVRYLPVYAWGLLFLVATNVLTVAIPRLQKEVFDELAGARRSTVVEHNAGLIALAAVLVIGVRTLSRVLFFNPGRTIEFRLRNDMLRRLLAMSPQFFRTWSIGDLMARATDDATYVRALVGFAVIMLLNTLLAASMALAQMVRIDAWLTLACVVPLLLAVWLLRQGAKWSMTLMKDGQVLLGRLSDHVLESYKGIAVVQGAAAEAAFLKRFDSLSDGYTALNLRQAALRTFLMPVVGVVGNLCIFLLLWLGGRHVVARQMTLGDVAAYASYVTVLVGALASAGWVVGVLQRGMVSLRRVWDVVSLRSDLPDGDLSLSASKESGGLHVQVRGLSWRHDADAAAPWVLRDIDFDLPAGKVLGLYGAVGSGKSTLVSLLARLAVPPRGTVMVDGIDLCDVAEADLRQAIAVVPQEAFLFSRGLGDNIGFADRAEQVDAARVAQAIGDAQLADEVARMPDGLHTVVGEKGLMLSGGQRQRAQLARAFYHGGRLLLLDDVLSAVDHDTEERLLAVLRRHIAAQGTSAIIVSHRLSALARCDEILVLADPASDQRGRIVERGSHAGLVAGGGAYAAAWSAQQSPP